jgi:hypothetical protein
MIVLIISEWSSTIGWVGSKSRSLGQISEKSCLHSRGCIFGPIFHRLAQDLLLDDISDEFDNVGSKVKK